MYVHREMYDRTSHTDCLSASADRRPVDPPPVVELRILEGDSRNDITFSHNANFFLYTTLESARPIAQGRANALPAPFPVLTGMPVAGMAYLDRPSPAGYFIFPDLSVRHEGKYRLSFNLFEELKEAKDADAEPAINNPDHPNNKLLRSSPMAPQAHVHFRLEVKSEPFVVYSAKKFPGLAESTQLSRVVAEQGCRVRIRRDVRMRRRDTKPNKDYDYDEDEGSYSRATPDIYAQQPGVDRARSISNASIDNQSVYNPMEQRRPSNHDMTYYAQNSYQHAPAPLSQPVSNNYSSHLSFGGSSAPQYQTPAMPPSVPQPPQAYPTNSSYPYPNGSHLRQNPNSQNYVYPTNPTPQQPQYHISQGYEDNNDYKAYRQPSLASSTPIYHSQPTNSHPVTDSRPLYGTQNYYPQSIQPSIQSSITSSNIQVLPPLKTIQPPNERKYEPNAEVKMIPGSIIPSSVSSTYDTTSSGYGQYASAVPTPIAASGRKRSFGKVFDTTHINQSIHSGMRPDTSAHGQDVSQIILDDGEAVDDEEELPSLKMLSYRRADGSRQHKKCPSPITG